MPYYFIGSSLLYTLAMLVSQSPPDDPQGPPRAPIDHFVIWLLGAFLLISNAYCSGLSAILTIQRTENPLDTIYDLDRHKVTWLAPHEAFLFALLPSTEPAVIRVMGLFKRASEIEMENFLRNPKTRYAYAIEVLANGNYAMGPFIQPWSMARLRLMRDYLYYGWVSVMTNKGSPYTNSLNEVIFRLRESGILLYWEGDTARATIGTRRILAVANSLLKETPPVMPLQWHHIQGTMLVLFFGYLLATIAFMGERFCYSRKRKRNDKLL